MAEEEVAARNVIFSNPDWQVTISLVLSFLSFMCALLHRPAPSLWTPLERGQL